MDSKEDGVDTKSRLTNGILNLSNSRTEERAKTITEHRPKHAPEKKTGFAALVDKLKKSEVGQTAKAAGNFFNPFDGVKAGDAMDTFLNHKQSDTMQEVARGASRATDSASLGLFSNLDKKLNDREPAYNSARKIGEGGGTDMITSGLGYLVPGLGTAKAVKGVGLGAKAGSTGLSRFGQVAREGAIAGAGVGAAEVGIREGLNPDDYNYKQNLAHVGIGAATGAIADPLLDGVGQLASNGLARLAKGEVPEFTGKPSADVLEQLRPKQSNRMETPHTSLFERLQNIKPKEQPMADASEQIAPSLDRLRKGRDFEPIEAEPNIGGGGLIDTQTRGLKAGKDYEPIEAMEGNGSLIRLKEPKNNTPVDIQNPKEFVKKQISMDANKETKKWSFDKFMTAVVDDLRPLDKATRELGGKDLSIDKNPYTQARLARGVAGRAETYLKGGIYSPEGKKVGNSLQEIIKPIENNIDDFLAYATSKRALDYDEKGLTAGIKPKDVGGFNDRQLADATIKQLEKEFPKIKEVHSELVKYNNALMDDLVDSGVLSQEAVDSMRVENPNYVPMFRVQDPTVRGFQPLTNPKKTYVNLGAATKKRTGSEKPIINPIESIIKNTYLSLNMAERNRAGRSLLELVEGAGDNAWGRVANVEKGLSVDDITDSLEKAGKETLDDVENAVDGLFKGKGNKVYVYRDGEKVEMELQEDLYKAVLSLDAQKQNFFVKMLALPTRTLRAGAVLSPDFGPVNIFRDQLSALINSKYGFIPGVDMIKGLTNVLKKDDVYWQWKNNGGANSVLSSLDREYLQKDLRTLMKEPLSKRVKRTLQNPKEIPLKAVDKVISPLRTVSEITEEATRLGEFKKGLKKGATPKEAAFSSRDLIDFNRAGNLGRQFNQVTAFFNAAVQSMDKLARTFKENPVGATIKATAGITLPSVVAYMYNKDKEWYKEIPQKERDLYWHFEAGDQIYKLPKPFEAGILFGTTAERFLDFMETNDPKAFEDFGNTVKSAFTPNWIPTAIQPWIEVYGNKSLMFDSPIVPRREEDLLPEDQFGPYQSELSKGLGKIAKKSPRKIEHVFKGYTGGLGKYFLQGTDTVAQLSGKEKPELPDRGMADMPVVNRFVVKNLEGNNQSVNDFYKRMDKLRRKDKSADKKGGDNPYKDMFKEISKINRDISELQKEKRAIIEDANMSGKQKTVEIKSIDQQITQLAKEGNGIE
ncbi:LPD38 domain-containing protein [Peribacillus simplex]|uniref:LPD38 domain-containing protein n=1 Tax=Peribacillus simplex TaxID=1478 RepID=UPI003D29C7A3